MGISTPKEAERVAEEVTDGGWLGQGNTVATGDRERGGVATRSRVATERSKRTIGEVRDEVQKLGTLDRYIATDRKFRFCSNR